MKKTLTALTLCAATLLGASCSPSKEKMKEDFMKKCEGDMATSLGSDANMKTVIHNYCDCSGTKVVDKFSVSEIKAFDKMTPAEQQAKLMPVIQTCVDDLQKAMLQNASGSMPAQ